MKRAVLIGWLMAGAAGLPAARAETVYRCGPPEARIYSQTPCAGADTMRISDDRSPAQQAAARATHRSDAAFAERLQRERQQAERQATVRHAARLTVTPEQKKVDTATDAQPKSHQPKRSTRRSKKPAPGFSERFIAPASAQKTR
jgi:hypothetical protein